MPTPPRPERSLLARRHAFSSAHLYKQDQFSDAENRRHFGLCYSEYGHGHNYVLEAYLAGQIDPQSGLVINLTELDEILKEAVRPLDHHHLNFDVPEFRTSIPTTENIALYLRERVAKDLAKRRPKLCLVKVRLYETEDLWVEISGGADCASN